MKKISSPSLENLTLKSTLAPPPISTPILPCLVPIRDFDVTKALAGRKWRKRDSKPPPPFHENSWNSSSKQHSLFPPFDYETRGNRWTNGRRSRGENGMRRKLRTCPQSKTRVARPEVGAAGQKFWFGRSDAGRGIFPTIGMLDTRITQIEILVSPTDICRIPAIHVSVHRSRERERGSMIGV